MSLAAVADGIAPLAQKADHGSCEAPFDQLPLSVKWPQPEVGQQPVAPHPTLHHDLG
jgi:hypothetical protein